MSSAEARPSLTAASSSSGSSSLSSTGSDSLLQSVDGLSLSDSSAAAFKSYSSPAVPTSVPSGTASDPTTPALSPPLLSVPPSLTSRVSAPVTPGLPKTASPQPRPSPAPLGGTLKAGVRGTGPLMGGMKIPPSMQQRLAAVASRSSSNLPGTASGSRPGSRNETPPPLLPRPSSGAGVPPPAPMGRVLPSGPSTGGSKPHPGAVGGMKRKKPGLTLSALQAGEREEAEKAAANGTLNGDNASAPGMAPGTASMRARALGTVGGTPFSNFRKIVDPSGRLNFASKAVVHASGVDFSSGASFNIKMDDLELAEELGKGNYGTVQKAFHKPTKVTMALKEIRLELDDSKLKTIITELDILHRSTSPYIIDFYGAFFIESCVYYCMELMDAGSLDDVGGCDIPEDVLARITKAIVLGLKFLKDEMQTMHRDVKPTNVLINKKGEVKLCDFGVSGQLERSLAKTNIGCQSYMAPERIQGESQGVMSSYSVASDVWSLGLSIIEVATGHYPYPPETYSNVFAQLTAIVHGEPPTLPPQYSDKAKDFVAGCLKRLPRDRPTYAQMLEHPFLKEDETRDVDVAGWVERAREYRKAHPRAVQPVLP